MLTVTKPLCCSTSQTFHSAHVLIITALIIYGADTDYSRRFEQEGDDFIVDKDDFVLMGDNGSLIVTFPSGKVNHRAKARI